MTLKTKENIFGHGYANCYMIIVALSCGFGLFVVFFAPGALYLRHDAVIALRYKISSSTKPGLGSCLTLAAATFD